MNTKKLSSAAVILAITAVAYVLASVLFCYTTKPEVTAGEFPFSVTYEYKGNTKTLSGVLKCEYSGSATVHGEHHRYWSGEVTYDNPYNVENPFVVEQNDQLQTSLSLHENMDAGYFMGDPLRNDYYITHGYDGVQPRICWYDYKNGIFQDDADQDELPEHVEFKILDFTYADPVEKSFSFSGIRYDADNVLIFVAIMAVYLLLCLIFVRKDTEFRYSGLDKAGIVFNFLVAFIAVPFITVACMLFGIVESHIELINQIMYNIPPFAILCLGLSVVFRRKGHSGTGFFIQFGGILLFVLVCALEALT